MRFDVDRFIRDLGGPSATAKACGVARTTPYRWAKTGRINVSVLASALETNNINLMDYFTDKDADQ